MEKENVAKEKPPPAQETAMVPMPSVPQELERFSTEQMRPQRLATQKELPNQGNTYVALVCGERLSIDKSCPVEFNCLAYMESENLWPSREVKGTKEWKLGALMVDDEGLVWGVGSIYVIKVMRRIIAANGGYLPKPCNLKFIRVPLPDSMHTIRCTFQGNRRASTNVRVPESKDANNSDGDSEQADAIPF